MIKIIKPRFKTYIQLKEKLWKFDKISKFKKKKWLKTLNFLKKDLPLTYNFNETNIKIKKKINLKNIYFMVLKLKKRINNFYGPMRFKYLKKLIFSLKYKDVSYKNKKSLQKSTLNINLKNSIFSYYNNSKKKRYAGSIFIRKLKP